MHLLPTSIYFVFRVKVVIIELGFNHLSQMIYLFNPHDVAVGMLKSTSLFDIYSCQEGSG